MTKIKKNLVLWISILFLAVLTIALPQSERTAEASEAVSVESVTATVMTGVAKGKPSYSYGAPYPDGKYARDIVITFSFVGTESCYYRIECTVNGEEPLEGLPMKSVPIGQKVTFSPTESGINRVTCHAIDFDGITELGSVTVTVKNDTEQPTLPDVDGAMNTWVKKGKNHTVLIDWSTARDGFSGLKTVGYSVKSSAKEEEIWYDDFSQTDVSVLSLSEESSVRITLIDGVGNTVVGEYTYNRFDGTSPDAPSYTVSPTTGAGVYAQSYSVTATYPEDTESGIAEKKYKIRTDRYDESTGKNTTVTETYSYEGPFELSGKTEDGAKASYTLTFYSVDNVGNYSENTVFTLGLTAFDVTEPSVTNVYWEIDVTNSDGAVYLSFVGDDYGESGISYAKLTPLGKYFGAQTQNGYTLYWLRFDVTSASSVQTIEVADRVGNKTFYTWSCTYFSGESGEKLLSYIKKYRTADLTKVAETGKKFFDEGYKKINNLLNVADCEEEDFEEAFALIDGATAIVAEHRFTVASAPKTVSAAMTYTYTESDFEGDTTGNLLEVQLSESTGSLSSESGFYDYFRLAILKNGQNVSSLKEGVKVTFSVPVAYINRNITLYNATTGASIPVAYTNNKGTFTLKETTDLALYIEGSRQSDIGQTIGNTSTSSVKTITVFGRNLSYGLFLGVVLGVSGVAIVAIVLLVIMKGRG